MIAPRAGGGDVYLLSILQRVGRIDNDPVLQANASQDFQRGAVIAPDRDGTQLHFVIRPHYRYSRAFLAEEHRIYRNCNLVDVDIWRKVHFPERTSQQAAILVRNINFSQQRARDRIDRVGRARYRSFELRASNFLYRDVGWHSDLDRREISLRDV